MFGESNHCDITAFKAKSFLILEKCLRSFLILGHLDHIGHVTRTHRTKLVILIHGYFTCNLALIRKAFLKKKFEKEYSRIHDV